VRQWNTTKSAAPEGLVPPHTSQMVTIFLRIENVRISSGTLRLECGQSTIAGHRPRTE
jgi:hypothetical protein